MKIDRIAGWLTYDNLSSEQVEEIFIMLNGAIGNCLEYKYEIRSFDNRPDNELIDRSVQLLVFTLIHRRVKREEKTIKIESWIQHTAYNMMTLTSVNFYTKIGRSWIPS